MISEACKKELREALDGYIYYSKKDELNTLLVNRALRVLLKKIDKPIWKVDEY